MRDGIENQLERMFGEERGRQVFYAGWDKFKGSNLGIIAIPELQFEYDANELLLARLKEIEADALSSFEQKFTRAKDCVELYVSVICRAFPYEEETPA